MGDGRSSVLGERRANLCFGHRHRSATCMTRRYRAGVTAASLAAVVAYRFNSGPFRLETTALPVELTNASAKHLVPTTGGFRR